MIIDYVDQDGALLLAADTVALCALSEANTQIVVFALAL